MHLKNLYYFNIDNSVGSTKGITLAYNRIDFVNVPVETGEYQEM